MAENNSITAKRCGKCGETKPLEAFAIHRDCLGGRNGSCKACRNSASLLRRYGPGPASHGEGFGPTTRVLDEDGRDWAWAFVVFAEPPGRSGYLCGSDGSLWCCRRRGVNTPRWRRIKPYVCKKGYKIVALRHPEHNKNWPYKLHRLILETFIGPCPVGEGGCHNNDNKLNNGIRNLRWGTLVQNSADAFANGKRLVGSRHWKAKLTEDQVRDARRRFRDGASVRELAGEFGVAVSTMRYAVNGVFWKHVESEN